MPRVLAWLGARELRERVTSALEGIAVTVFVGGGYELLVAMEHRLPILVLIDGTIGRERPIIPILQRLHVRFPSTRVVVFSALTAQSARALFELARVGASAVVFPDLDDVNIALRTEIAAAKLRGQTQAIIDGCATWWTDETREIVRYCLDHSSRRTTSDVLAFGLGVSRKTLAKRLAAASLPPPSTLLSLARVLSALWRIEHLESSVENAATSSGFDSATGLRNMVRRYTGLTLTEVRRRGGVTYILRRLDSRQHAPTESPCASLERSSEHVRRHHGERG